MISSAAGRPPEIDEIAVVVATLADQGRPPARLGVTHWSAGFSTLWVPRTLTRPPTSVTAVNRRTSRSP